MPTDSNPRPRRSAFRFTLREILIGTVAIAALLALAVKSYKDVRPFKPTSFYEQFDVNNVKKTLAAICKKSEIPFRAPGSRSSSGMSGSVADRQATISISTPNVKPGSIVTELHRKVEGLLKEHKCQIEGYGYSGRLKDNSLSGFSFQYRRDTTVGHVFVYTVPGSGDNWELVLIMHEHRY